MYVGIDLKDWTKLHMRRYYNMYVAMYVGIINLIMWKIHEKVLLLLRIGRFRSDHAKDWWEGNMYVDLINVKDWWEGTIVM